MNHSYMPIHISIRYTAIGANATPKGFFSWWTESLCLFRCLLVKFFWQMLQAFCYHQILYSSSNYYFSHCYFVFRQDQRHVVSLLFLFCSKISTSWDDKHLIKGCFRPSGFTFSTYSRFLWFHIGIPWNIDIMVIRVVEFSNGGYKIRKIFA